MEASARLCHRAVRGRNRGTGEPATQETENRGGRNISPILPVSISPVLLVSVSCPRQAAILSERLADSALLRLVFGGVSGGCWRQRFNPKRI
jgi:hypothetical protein